VIYLDLDGLDGNSKKNEERKTIWFCLSFLLFWCC